MKSQTNKILLLIVVPAITYGCGQEGHVAENASRHTETENHTVMLSEGQATAAGITLGAIASREIFEKIKANGYFDAPPQNKAQVSTIAAGYVKKTTLLIGDVVKKGQVVATLENPEYVRLQQNFMEVSGQLDYLKSEYERKKILQEENIASRKNLLKAEADYKSTLARHTGLKKALQMMGFNVDNVLTGKYTATLAIRAPIDGTVTAVNLVIGKYVRPEEILLEIIDTDHLHIELSIFEKDILRIKEGQVIHLRIPSLDHEIHEGEIYLVGKAFDQEKRTVNVHGHLKDEENTFIPGTYVEADILVESHVIEALPQAAVVSLAGKEYIFVEIGRKGENRQYQRVEVETGRRSEDWVEVKLADQRKPGGGVVVGGVYFLSSALEEKIHDH